MPSNLDQYSDNITGPFKDNTVGAIGADDIRAFSSVINGDLNALQPLDSDLTAIAALTTTAYGRSLLTAADAAAARVALAVPADLTSRVDTIEFPVKNTQTVSYTLVLGDSSKVVEINSGSATNLTVPPNASVAFTVGTMITVVQYGAGQITILPGAGVTVNSRGAALKLAGQFAEAVLTKRATNEWMLSGDVTT